jgi:hypothetical protein
MQNLLTALDGALRVLVVGLVLGAGLPVLFTVGLRGLSSGRSTGAGPRRAARSAGVLCLTVVVCAIALGLTAIVASGLGRHLALPLPHLP